MVKCGGLRCSHPTTDMELLDMKESNELRERAGRRIQERRSRERRSAESEYRASGFEARLMHDRRMLVRRSELRMV